MLINNILFGFQVYLEQKTNYSERSWSDQFTALFGAYDKDVNDVLTLMVSQPDHGSVTVSEPILIPPEIEHCLSPAPVCIMIKKRIIPLECSQLKKKDFVCIYYWEF